MKTKIFLLILSAVFIFGGCASTKQARDVDASKLSGFLDDYSILRKGVAEEALLVYRNPQALWPVYKNIIIDPAEIWLRHKEKKGFHMKTCSG
jgi:hypothetical protein